MATWYAWTTIRGGKTVNVGEKVTAKDLGVTDEEFNQLIEARAVRTAKYPDSARSDESPTEMYRRKARELAEGAMSDAELAALNDAEVLDEGDEVAPEA